MIEVRDADNIKIGTFPSGEPLIQGEHNRSDDVVKILLTGYSAEEFLQVLHLCDLYRECRVKLYLPFFPGARQDRRDNTPLSCQVFANALNAYNLDEVVVFDPHSDVTPALINHVRVLSQCDLLLHQNVFSHFDGVIAPDAGATKKVFALSRLLSIPMIQCNKHRDPMSGNLSGFEVPKVQPGNYLVVDDICDGGGTFVGLGEQWKKLNLDSKLSLFVSHGIFTKGLESLLKFYEMIYTTDSFYQADHPRLQVLKINY